MTEHLSLMFLTAVLAACGATPAPRPTPPAVATSAPAPREAAPPAEPAPLAEPAPPAPPAPAQLTADLLASERTAWDTAKPVFDKACASCHTKAGKKAAKKKLAHFDMDSYPLGGHHAGTIGSTIRDVLGVTGKKPTMPYDKPGSVKGDDLAKIQAWTDAWEAADKGGAHPPAAPDKDDD